MAEHCRWQQGAAAAVARHPGGGGGQGPCSRQCAVSWRSPGPPVRLKRAPRVARWPSGLNACTGAALSASPLLETAACMLCYV